MELGYYGSDHKYFKTFEGLRIDDDGTMAWQVNRMEEKTFHRRIYIVKDDVIECYTVCVSVDKLMNKNTKSVGNNVLEDILLIFGNDNLSTDIAMNMGGDASLEDPNLLWKYKTNKIKVIEPQKENNRIHIKKSIGREFLETFPEDFDKILDRIVSICPNANIGKV